MDVSKFYDSAKVSTDEAVAHEKAQKFPEAIAAYEDAVQHIISGIRFDKVTTRVTAYQAQAGKLMDRIQQIKGFLADPSSYSGGSGGATATKPPGEKGADDETAKLQGALSNAILSEKPNVRWDDVAGLEGAKDALKEAVILPARFPQLFTGKRKPWKGVMLYGPPGTGKSYLAKALATEAESTFLSVSVADLVSKWQGESERLVRGMFELARARKPAIVFVDEIDALCRERGGSNEGESSRRIMNEFLVQFDGVGKSMDGVLFLAATNVPWEIDPAMRRRFEKRIYIPLPETHARAKMFQVHLGNTPHTLSAADFDVLAERCEHFSGSDISVVVREALMEPLRKCRTARYWRKGTDGKYTPVEDDPPCSYCTPDLASRPAPHKVPCRSCGHERVDLLEMKTEELRVPDVCMEDFVHVLKRARPSVALKDLAKYEEWTASFGNDGA